MKRFTKEFFLAMFVRAVWTMAEVALGMITVGARLGEINWLNMASVAAVAGIASLLKSLVVGLPEIVPEVKPEDS